MPITVLGIGAKSIFVSDEIINRMYICELGFCLP